MKFTIEPSSTSRLKGIIFRDVERPKNAGSKDDVEVLLIQENGEVKYVLDISKKDIKRLAKAV